MLQKKKWQAALFLLLCCLEFITIELFLGRNLLTFPLVLWLKNISLFLAANGILAALCHRFKPAMLFSTMLVLLVGIANYFVRQFRGYGIVYMDFYALNTAFTVAGHYSYHIDVYFFAGLMSGLLSFVLCFLFPVKGSPYFAKKSVIASMCGLAAGGLFFLWIAVSGVFWEEVSSLTWDHRIGIQEYGYPLYFLANARTEKVSPPVGYSVEKAEEILSRYSLQSNAGGGSREEKAPNLIMIMNESFADLRVIGDFYTNQPVMPFWDELKENTVKGYALSSVYGGYTANSEFEFLTGCTKAYLPGNPYLQYINDSVPSLMTILKSQGGYQKAIAMHPYYASGYNRNRVYPLLSFDSFLTLDDFTRPELVRGYVSDREDYRKICSLYEKKDSGSSLCLFNVTMQNHSSYTEEWTGDNPVTVTSVPVDSSVNQYLSLMKLSDDALRELITYFQRESEPTVILLFGDHQPHLPDRFYQKLTGKLPVQFSGEDVVKQHLVPFLIWANYDIPENEVEVISINYLSSLLLQTVGLEMSAYQRFLLDLQTHIPAISAKGYFDVEGELHQTEAPDKESGRWLQEYEIVQYNYLFDEENRLEEYYTLPD